MEIPRDLVEHVLLGPAYDRRQMQDSPILSDVWIGFAKTPNAPLELLITPFAGQSAGKLAIAIDERLSPNRGEDPNIAYLQGVVAAKLYFEEVLSIVVPMTKWWHDEQKRDELANYLELDTGVDKLNATVDEILRMAREWGSNALPREQRPSALERYISLAALVLWAKSDEQRAARKTRTRKTLVSELRQVSAQNIADLLIDLFSHIRPSSEPLALHVSLNRTAVPAIARSIPTVKADAARTLFAVNCSQISWAIIDSGIAADHPAFADATGGKSRITTVLDFSNIRRIVSVSNAKPNLRVKNLQALQTSRLKSPLPPDADAVMAELGNDAKNERPIHWELVEKLVAIDASEPPRGNHGTHVAGILAANATTRSGYSGMCPDIKLLDFRVLGPTLEETEFAVIAALQYIRFLNERNRFMSIHGANLSLSIPHDVRNYACGQTPICLECERLVESGVVVVAAAGNHGYHSFETAKGSFEGYAAFSITDPGNADGVITVGSTHRYSPHTYGVSFFSSRGPTGDGRLKPDIVAPGERITATLPESQWGDQDGTSMAAPHVSGAAAMLMARYSELVGQPRRIKKILCESATDLGRERSFQGHGMLDVLRAFQSI